MVSINCVDDFSKFTEDTINIILISLINITPKNFFQ